MAERKLLLYRSDCHPTGPQESVAYLWGQEYLEVFPIPLATLA
jgi:hypothetical protein